MKKDGESSGGVVMRWEKLLPGMNMRVLLVEVDDSTRHIIAALLRKCSYRVAAVPDGLKAREILKARCHKIDLILMEVDLPSISGFALLTLIMEHEICKNIPVIMMSFQDPINIVYKCMTRGVSDYLVKPIRKNELRNLWQHVWRRQSEAIETMVTSSAMALLKIEEEKQDTVSPQSKWAKWKCGGIVGAAAVIGGVLLSADYNWWYEIVKVGLFTV